MGRLGGNSCHGKRHVHEKSYFVSLSLQLPSAVSLGTNPFGHYYHYGALENESHLIPFLFAFKLH